MSHPRLRLPTLLHIFKWERAISTLCGRPLKLLDKFTYLSSNFSSTKNDVNLCLAKAWTAINRLSIIWRSNLSDKIKRDFFPSHSCLNTFVWMHYIDANKMHWEKAWWELYKNATCCFEQILEARLHKTAAVRLLTSHLKNHPSNTNQTCWTLLKKQKQTHKWRSSVTLTNLSYIYFFKCARLANLY